MPARPTGPTALPGGRPHVPEPANLGPMARRAAGALGLGESYWPWLRFLEGADGPGPEASLDAGDAARLLERLGCGRKAVADAIATFPDPERDPERLWLIERCRRRLVAAIGDLDAELERLPVLPATLALAGSCFPIHVFVATVPAVRAWHAARGVPDDVSWATLADLGRHVAIEERISGQTGVDAPWWMMLHVRGAIFETGALQYAPYHTGGPGSPSPWYDEEAALRLGPGFLPGDLGFGIHIPEGAPLDRQSCLDSMRRAGQLFDHLFGEVLSSQGRRLATCSSWLLDDQLAAYLPDESNIVSFQRMFQLVPGWGEADDSVLTFVFRNQGVPPDIGHAKTRLQRGVLAHLSGGGHFRWRTGWCDLPPWGASPLG